MCSLFLSKVKLLFWLLGGENILFDGGGILDGSGRVLASKFISSYDLVGHIKAYNSCQCVVSLWLSLSVSLTMWSVIPRFYSIVTGFEGTQMQKGRILQNIMWIPKSICLSRKTRICPSANQNCLVSPSIVYRLIVIVIIIWALQRQVSRRTRFSQTVVKSSAPSHETRFRQSYQGWRRNGSDNQFRPSSSSLIAIVRIHESIVVHCILTIWMQSVVFEVYSRPSISNNFQRFASVVFIFLKITLMPVQLLCQGNAVMLPLSSNDIMVRRAAFVRAAWGTGTGAATGKVLDLLATSK